jgi:hypothetical protein
MVSSSSALATLRPDIAESFEEFDLEMNAAGFIASLVAPVRQTGSAAGHFGIVPVEELLNREAKKRERGGYQRSSFKFEPTTYSTQEYGLEELVDDKEEKLYRSYLQLEIVTGRRCYHGLLASYERRVAELLTSTATFGDAACTATWRDYENAVPIDDIERESQLFYDEAGMWPNTLIVTKKRFRDLRQSFQIIDRIKHWGGDDPKTKGIQKSILAALFDVENIHIANAVRKTSAEGATTALGSIWDDDKAILALVQPGDDIQTPTVARTFHWSEDSELDGVVESYRDESVRADVIRCRHQTGEKVMYSALGRIITGVGAAP